MEHDEIIITDTNEIGTKVNTGFAGKVIMPLFEIVSTPTIRIGDVKRRRFSLIDR
jgi:hypothetical protein